MTDPRLLELVELWRQACTDFATLVRQIPPEQWELPTDLEGWSVKDNAAHTAHLEAVLAGAPEETIEVPDAPHLKTFVNRYTEQGVVARRGCDMTALADELEQAVATRHAELLATDPIDPTAAPPRTPGGAPWNFGTLLTNRPLDVWMHDQDVRRAIGRPGGYDGPVAAHVLALLGLGLPMVVGKRVAPPAGTTLRLTVPDAGLSWTVGVGEDGRAAPVDDVDRPTATVTLSPEDFVVLAGGRRTPDATDPVIEGDQELARRLLGSMAMTP